MGPQLHFNQTSPIRLPLPLMLVAPLFGVAAMVLAIAAAAGWPLDRWSPLMIGAVHLFTLGFLASTMLAALLQMLPVLTGRPPLRNAIARRIIQLGLPGGVLALVVGLTVEAPMLVKLAVILLACAFCTFLACVLPQFGVGSRIRPRITWRPSLVGIALALTGLAITVTLGTWLLAGWGFDEIALRRDFTDVHAGWAMVGWVAPLILAVSLDVVPMFQFTRPLPRLLHVAPALLFGGMLLATVPISRNAGFGIIAFVLAMGSTMILERQWRRPHGKPDGTFRLFRIAMLSLLASVAVFCLSVFAADGTSVYRITAVLLFLAGFAGSCVLGMLLKIVPFLLRLELQKQVWELGMPARTLPAFTRMLPVHADRWLWAPQAAGLLLACAGLFASSRPAFQLGIALLAIAMLQAAIALWQAAFQARKFVKTLHPEETEPGLV